MLISLFNGHFSEFPPTEVETFVGLRNKAVWQEEPTKRLARNAYYFDDVAKT